MTRRVDENWKLLQQTTFTKWVNNALRGHRKTAKTQVTDLQTDLRDGLVLVELIETIAAPKKIGRYNKKPVIKPQMLENLSAVFRFLEREEIKVVNIGATDIYNGVMKLILGLLWTLIRHFQIRSTGKDLSTKSALLAWINTLIPDQKVSNFTTDWNDGIALCALVDRIRPGLCPHYATLRCADGLENCQLGIELAEDELGIPKLLEASDLSHRDVDEYSVMTYVSYFCKPAKDQLMGWIQSMIPQRKVTNFKTDWNNGINLACLVNTLVPGSFPECGRLDPHDALQNLTKGMKIAEEHLDVKPVVAPSQLAKPNVDELIVVTYLSRFQYAKAVPQPQDVTCTGHGLRKAFVGRPASFQVDTSRAGVGELNVTITSMGGVPVAADINPLPDKSGFFEVRYIPNKGSELAINVSWAGQPIPRSPFIVDIFDSGNFTLTGSQVMGGQCARIGKPVKMEVKGVVDIGDLYVMIQHPDAHTSTAVLKPNGIDSVECSYTPTRIGTDDIFVKVAGEDIPGSPFSVRIVDPSQCSISHREPSAGKRGLAYKKVTFTVTASKDNMQGVLVELNMPNGKEELSLEPQANGLNIGSFVPPAIGNYSVVATCAGENVRGSPLAIVISDPGKCAILDMIPRYLQVNQSVELNVSTKGAGPGTLDTSSNQSGILSTSLIKRDSDFYSLRLTPQAIGESTIDITWNGEHLSNTPFSVLICDASKCSAYGPGLTEGKGKVGERFTFVVQATRAGRGDLVVKPAGRKAVYAAEIKETQRGAFSVYFTTYETGPHTIDILWGGQPIVNSPFKVEFTKGTEVTQFIASGEGLKNTMVLQKAKFSILGPESGLVEREILKVKVSGETAESEAVVSSNFDPLSGKMVVCITDNGNGSYSVEYAVPKPGRYSIAITCDEEHIPGSPYMIKALPAPDARKCTAFGEAVDNPSTAVVGRPLDFQVDSTRAGTGYLKVTATDPASKVMPIYLAEEKPQDGSRIHSVKVHPNIQGSHKVVVEWCEKEIPGSPFSFEVSDPKNVKVLKLPDGESFIAEVGELFSFEIDPRKAGGKGEIEAAYKMEDGSLESIEVTEQKNRKFLAKCVPKKPGNLELLLTFNGVNILSSPWSCHVANLSLFQVNHPKGYGHQKEYVKFMITGLTKKNLSKMTVTAVNPQHKATVKIDYGKDRTAVARFTAKHIGEYRCEVLCGQKHITGSPFYVLVANPEGCKIVGSIPSVLAISRKAEILVETKEAGPGELSFSAESSGGSSSSCLDYEMRVKSTDPTSHQVIIKALSCGKCNFFLKWANYDIPGVPVEINVVDPQKCTFSCLELFEGPIKQEKLLEVTIDTTQGGNCQPQVVVKGPKAPCVVELSKVSAGKHVAKFSPFEEGVHTFDVKVGGARIAGCPAKFEVVKPVDPNKVTVGGPGLKGAIANRRTELTVFARESRLIERGMLSVDFETSGSSSSLKSTDSPSVDCRDNGNGTYNLSFTPSGPGTLQLNIKTEGVQVLGSPFNIKVRPEPNAQNCTLSGKVIENGLFAVVREPVELIVDTSLAGTGSLGVSGVQPDHSPLRIYATEERTAQRTLHFLKFDPVMIGTHQVSVKWEGEDIPGVPLNVAVIDSRKCTVEDALPTSLRIGASYSFSVFTAGAGEGKIEAHIKGTGLTAKCEEDEEDGKKFTVTLTGVQFGEAKVDVKFGGFSIHGSPYNISVCDPSQCSIDSGAMAENVVVGVPFSFTVKTSGAGQAKLQVNSISTHHQYTTDVKKTDEDRYTVTCTAWSVGEQGLHVTFGQETIPGSPLEFSVSDPKKCVITGLPDPANFIPIIGEPITFSVDTTNAGPGTLASFATSVDEATEELESTDEGTLTNFKYVPKRAGTLELSLDFNGINLLSSKWVSEVPDPGRFSVTPPKGYGRKREYVKFPITGLTEGTKNILIKATHPNHDATVKTEQGKDDGTVIARFTAKHVGEYRVEVTHGWQHIDGSPFTVTVCDPEACHVISSPPSALHVGITQTISIATGDAGPGELACICESLSGDIVIESEVKVDDESGTYNIHFRSISRGNGRIRAQWGGYDVPSATFDVCFVDSSLVTWSSQPNILEETVTQGERIQIDIDGRNGGFTTPTVNLVGSQSSFAVQVTPNNNGTFVVNINTWQVGQNTIHILWGEHSIPNTPISFNVAKTVDARSVTATGDGLKNAVSGVPAHILIHAPESGLLERGLLTLTCKATIEDDSDEEDSSNLPSIDISDDGDGQYSASLLSSREGTYYLSIVCNNQPIYGSPFSVAVQAAADASKCRAFGGALEKQRAGLCVSDPVEFTVNTTEGGCGQLLVKVSKPDGSACRVYSLEEKDGSKKLHHLKFDADTVGHYTMEVLWDSSHIPNSPFDFNLTDPTKCSVSGMPSISSILNVDQSISFTVLAKEAGEGEPEVVIRQPGPAGEVSLSSTEPSPSVHEYTFNTAVLGTHTITVKFGGHSIPGSPFHFQVIDPTKFSITDLNLKGKYALVCELVSFRVQGKAPQNGNLVLVAHGPSADLTIENQKQSDGSYTCSFVPIEPGSYEVFVECAGKHVNGSPFTIRVADPSKCQILGELSETIQVGEPEEIVLKTRGAGAGELEIYLDGETENESVDYKIKNEGLDTYIVTLTGKKVCQLKLSIHWAGFSIPQSPFSLTVCDASLCKAFGNALMTKKGKAGEQVTFTVVAHRAGEGNLTVKATGPSAVYTVDVKLVKLCTYEASFTPWEIGEHSIDVLWGPMHIPKSPFIIDVANPMDRVVCNATGPGLKQAISTQPATFTITSNEVGLLDKNALKVSVIGVQSHAEVSVKDKNNGCYEVSYIAPTAGAYIASISFYDRQIPGSPFKINVVPGPDASNCRAFGPALNPNAAHIAGTPLEMSVDCSEGGYGSLRVYVQGPNDYRPRIFMADDGKGVYSIKFDAMKAGKYFVVVAWADSHVPGSPFKLRVLPAADPSKVVVSGGGVSDGRLGDSGEFHIDTKNAGMGTLLVRVHGIRDSFRVEAHPVSPDKPRLLVAHYHPTLPGEYTIFVRWSGVHVPGSPFTVIISKADGSLPEPLPLSPMDDELQQPTLDTTLEEETAIGSEPPKPTKAEKPKKKSSKKSQKKEKEKEKESVKAKKTTEKAASLDKIKKKEKSRKLSQPQSVGPVRAEMKMKSSPMMEGFALKPGQIPPGAMIAPDGQLVVRSPSGQFIPIQLVGQQQMMKAVGVEKTSRHHSSGQRDGDRVRKKSPPPVTLAHSDPQPPHQQKKKHSRR